MQKSINIIFDFESLHGLNAITFLLKLKVLEYILIFSYYLLYKLKLKAYKINAR